MTWRILKVFLFMFRRVFSYAGRNLRGSVPKEAYLTETYLDWARYVLVTFGVELEVRGREFLPGLGSAPRVLLSNHQSQLDIPVLVMAAEERVGFVAKRELSQIPLLAYWMRRVGCVFIDRGDKRAARNSLEAAAAALGPHLLAVFPEGTRSKTGQLLPIKLGGLRMAVLAGAQIVPVHIRNSRNAFEAKTAEIHEPIPVRLRFFPPLDTRGWVDGKASWLKAKDYLEECWREALAPSASQASSAL